MAQDNSQKINTLMGMLGDNPAEKINAVLNSLSGAGGNDAPPSPPPQQDAPQAVPTSAEAPQPSGEGSGGGFDMSTLMKLQGMMSGLGAGTPDDRSRLLSALRPFLNEQRRPHVDHAMQLLKLTKLAQTANELNLFKDFKL